MKAIFFIILIISFGFANLVVAQSDSDGYVEGEYDEDELKGEDLKEFEENYSSNRFESNDSTEDRKNIPISANVALDGSAESQVGNFVRFLLTRESAISKFEIDVPDGTEKRECSTDEAPAVNKNGKLGRNICTSCYYDNGGFSLSCGFKPF